MTPSYTLVPTRTFLKDLKKLNSQTKKRVSRTLNALKSDPYQGKKLINKNIGIWRIRIGDYRIRYDIEENSVILYLIRHRKDIYR